MWKKIRPYVYTILTTQAVGGLAGFLTKDQMTAYESIQKSSLTPPSIVFPIVWAILYLIMAVGAALVWQTGSHKRKPALILYSVQLAVNFFWSILFFNLRAYLFSFIWLILLWVLILFMIVYFTRIHKAAGLIQIPYLLWVTFAGYLNIVIWWLNR